MTAEKHIEWEKRKIQIETRWEQLYELEKEWGKESIKYLMVTNSGGAITTLSFIGAANNIFYSWLIITSLLLFFIGIILSGCLVAYAYFSCAKLFKNWQNDVSEFFQGNISHEELQSNDQSLVSSGKTEKRLGLIGFACFILGGVAGLICLFLN
ncbi:hypothetical protein H5P28_11310 [Ruficoccus amylovorans]|uniref:Uncharacterized protein n=1 Tax=Ruficoccus amylovorans TaxID=1804625 RepID=A0A842HH22_9BACT|nr:hypothetical protein [Ruficoccus amylovorans]MBC2594847.1 hypothetical protein [Ruficoccus amylovorans]